LSDWAKAADGRMPPRDFRAGILNPQPFRRKGRSLVETVSEFV
jgi:hypothetical protein